MASSRLGAVALALLLPACAVLPPMPPPPPAHPASPDAEEAPPARTSTALEARPAHDHGGAE